MKLFVYSVCTGLLLASGAASAEVDRTLRAYVKSVDTAKSTITFRNFNQENKQWEEITANFGQNKDWKKCEVNEFKCEAATMDLVKELHKDSKVFVDVLKENGSQDWNLTFLRTLPPKASMPGDADTQ
jgi:hypothetical protein